MANETGRFEAAMAEVQRRVEAGRQSGKYSEEIDEQLASEFSRMARDPLWFSSFERLPEAVADVREARFGQALVEYTSGVPGGSQLHKAVGRAVSRQVSGLAQQMSAFALTVSKSLDAVVDALDETKSVIQADLLSDIDAVHHRLVSLEHKVARLEAAAETDTDG